MTEKICADCGKPRGRFAKDFEMQEDGRSRCSRCAAAWRPEKPVNLMTSLKKSLGSYSTPPQDETEGRYSHTCLVSVVNQPCRACDQGRRKTPPDDMVRECQRLHDLVLEAIAAWQESDNHQDDSQRRGVNARHRSALRDKLKSLSATPQTGTSERKHPAEEQNQ